MNAAAIATLLAVYALIFLMGATALVLTWRLYQRRLVTRSVIAIMAVLFALALSVPTTSILFPHRPPWTDYLAPAAALAIMAGLWWHHRAPIRKVLFPRAGGRHRPAARRNP